MGVRPSVTSSQRTTTQASITVSSFIFLKGTSPANGLPWWLSGKESACQAGDSDWIPGLERSPGEGNNNPFLYFFLGNPRDIEAWRATVHAVAKSET